MLTRYLAYLAFLLDVTLYRFRNDSGEMVSKRIQKETFLASFEVLVVTEETVDVQNPVGGPASEELVFERHGVVTFTIHLGFWSPGCFGGLNMDPEQGHCHECEDHTACLGGTHLGRYIYASCQHHA